MYNYNYYQYNTPYYSKTPNHSSYKYNSSLSNISTNGTNYETNNRNIKIIKLNSYGNNQYYNYNYMTKTPIQTPIKNPLINNYPQMRLVSKSQEPHISIYNKNMIQKNNFTNLNLNNKQNNYPINIKINNIQRINKIINITPYKGIKNKIYHAKTPEPNIRGRNKPKNKKIKLRFTNDITRAYFPLNTNQNQNNITYIGNNDYKTENLNLANKFYINSFNNNIPQANNNSNNFSNQISNTNYSRIINYCPIKTKNSNQYNKIRSISPCNPYNPYNTNSRNYIVNMNIPQKDLVKNRLRSFNLQIHHLSIHPKSNFDSIEFNIINLIGEGSFGKIYCVQWIKNNKLYAMKKLDIQSTEELNEFKSKVKIVDDLYKKTKYSGFIKLYADKVVPLYNQQICYNYLIIMELGERDWEKEIQLRLLHQKYYTEYELNQIINQLVKALSLMQQNNVTHRDIKPANVLIMNGLYKLCDFGEASLINGSGVVIQNVRGSQLFMSPILFYAYNHNISQVMHNVYKSDVYSFGMCVLLAATLSGYTLYDIREILDINKVSKIIINKLSGRYSMNFINLLLQMLQIDENLRMDFIQLENYIMCYCNY
jgi:hypothetical protein